MTRRLIILGSTGSIGTQALDVVEHLNALHKAGAFPHRFEVVGLAAGSNAELLAAQASRFGCQHTALATRPSGTGMLPVSTPSTSLSSSQLLTGPDAAERLVRTVECDLVLAAMVGSAGLPATLAAISLGRDVALANKETLVAGGALVMAEVRARGGRLLPVDSEHSAIFQALVGEDIAAVERIILTASGGALRDWPLDQLARATVKEALAHPNWAMGQRITIDSASMFNKALEVIETREYFGVDPDQIEVIIHPESLIHSMVGYRDGAIMAHMGAPDMRHSIGYALNWPDRAPLPVARLDLAQIGQMTFRSPDLQRYPALRLAREVMARRGLAGAAFNAAKEVALDHFLAGGIGFMDMGSVVEATLSALHADLGNASVTMTLEDVQAMDHLARIRAAEIARAKAGAG